MKNSLVLAVAIIALAVIMVLEFRYQLVINSPIVAKIDRLTGKVWIANSGVWRLISDLCEERSKASVPEAPRAAAKTK